MMISSLYISLFLFILIQIISIKGLTTSCHKNRFIDYNQMIETNCLIEACILSSNCADEASCECKRDYVVRYNVTIEHEADDHDDEHEEDSFVHLAVITQEPVDDNQSIIVSEIII
jgi:hypothetical protein